MDRIETAKKALSGSVATMQAYSFHLHGEHEHGPIGDDIAKARAAIATLAGLGVDLAELMELVKHALSVYKAHGYWIAADHLQEVLNRFEVKK